MLLSFTCKVVLHICARSDQERKRWADIFARLFENFNSTDSTGGWVGPQVVETEPVIKIEHWFNGEWALIKRVLRYFKMYQAAAEQEAVSLELTYKGVWLAEVVFADGWDALERKLWLLLDEEGQGVALAEWFDEQVELSKRQRLAEIGDPSATS